MQIIAKFQKKWMILVEMIVPRFLSKIKSIMMEIHLNLKIIEIIKK